MSITGDIIRRQREALDLSQGELGKRVGSTQRQIARFESGEAEPSLTIGLRLAQEFGISPTELGGMTPRGLDLSGHWWAAWQTWGETGERIDVHELAITQDGDFLQLVGDQARSVEDGSYAWVGEMRLWDNEALMGWYTASDGAVRSKGSLYFALHPHGQAMAGSWVGLSYAGLIIRGWGAITRDRAETEELINMLCAGEGNLTAWPMKPPKS